MRGFEIAQKVNNGTKMDCKAYEASQLPEYQTKNSAGADFFCAEDVVIPSIWKVVLESLLDKTGDKVSCAADKLLSKLWYSREESNKELTDIKPTLVHTGIKACMKSDEVLEIYSRSSNPKKLGLVLANSVGIIDSDYYGNADNDGEIMFAFYNFKLWDTEIKAGDRIGQGVFKKFLKPTVGYNCKELERTGGFGSTDSE